MLALLMAAHLAAASTGPHIIEDDLPKAMAAAKAGKKVLFVDAWAPWCHTCVYMREHVLNRPSFKAFEKDVVFSSVDTEKTASAAFLERYPVDVWPTLFFVDPVSGNVLLKWVGSADEAQMKALLEAVKSKPGAMRDADALLASGHPGEAAKAYQTAQAGKAGARSALSMLSALYLAKENQACAKAAVDVLPSTMPSQDRVAVLTWGLGCALALPEGAERTQALDALVAPSTAALALPDVLADDLSGLFEELVEERSVAKDEAGAKALAARWLAFLDAQAAAAKSPAQRAVFDPHRVNASLAAGVPQVMVEPLLLSEKQLPKDYNPAARLALIYRETGRLDDALAAVDRALPKCLQGPRRLRLLDVKAGILLKKGDAAGQKRVLEEALAYAKALPKSQVPPQRIAALEAQVAAAGK